MCTHDHNNWTSIKEINYRNIDRHVSQYCLYFILFFDGIKIVAELEFELRGGEGQNLYKIYAFYAHHVSI